MLWRLLDIVSFLLVDRISEFEPGKRARGHLRPPPEQAGLPPCLLVEAVGQLAAYVAIHWTGFASRPVAATAGDVRVLAEAIPGGELVLEIEITSAKGAAFGYRGRASQGGTPVIVLERSVSAFLPMADFDDPARVQRELEALLGAGLPERSIPTLETLRPNAKILELSDGRLRGEIAAPVTGSFYADHFPRRPVYPATLLLDAQIALASELLRRSRTSSAPRLERVRHVKVRAFTPPGGRLAVDVEQTAGGDDRAVLRLRATTGGEQVSSAQVEFVLDG